VETDIGGEGKDTHLVETCYAHTYTHTHTHTHTYNCKTYEQDTGCIRIAHE